MAITHDEVNPPAGATFPPSGEIVLIGDDDAEDRFLSRFGGR